MKSAAIGACVLLMMGGAAESIHAASLAISPVLVTVPATGQSTVVRLRNQATEAVLVQLTAVEWREPREIDSAPPAPEILVAPPVVMLEPNARQPVRVALRHPLESNTEQAYRLLITEVPFSIDHRQNGVTFAIRMDLPLFVTPRGAEPDPVWIIRDAPDGKAELVLRNEGRAHLGLSKLALHEAGAAVPLLAVDQGVFALAGGERTWRLNQQAYALPHRLEVRAETPRGELVMPLTHVRD